MFLVLAVLEDKFKESYDKMCEERRELLLLQTNKNVVGLYP